MTIMNEPSARKHGPDLPSDDDNQGNIPADPFTALNAAYGMLLTDKDFQVMGGNPRGKMMLHNAHLHGMGVMRGFRMRRAPGRKLQVDPGLAVDGRGHELLLKTSHCLDLEDLLDADNGSSATGDTRTVHAGVYACFEACMTDPVPTLVDPCDVTRRHDEYSRILETCRLELRPGPCPASTLQFPRVRMLLGLLPLTEGDPAVAEATKDARHARREVTAAEPANRARALRDQFRRMATLDTLGPPDDCGTGADGTTGQPCGECLDHFGLFPISDDDAVVLAGIEIEVRDSGGQTEILRLQISYDHRNTLLPSSVIQELTCGEAPALLHLPGSAIGEAPQVIGDKVAAGPDGRTLTIPVTKPLHRRSVQRRAVLVSTLGERGWVEEDTANVIYDDAEGPAIIAELVRSLPDDAIIRLVIKGTGPTPVYGSDPAVPLAGVSGRRTGPSHEGLDAVLTFPNIDQLRLKEAAS
ncbi:hypothetical protein J2X01_000303 [Arthrobacter ginsengisoli]|uniref:DUF222 domain-containing protein n=1 Tax=Arthrobacter ginsengisoli TaxID=1356565 RepID=A0ABU1U781_9MICC|nr:hypothetical protein [Arthrobacter ginsengisoli]MDR7081034.1 hypothetical protein [Arthrobacter ginsengisoli]